ncbi:MAG: restriction endonuclease subunit S, partial [Gemmatimonadetes bacterium]|nr:restriction endonuclease subunit S [Candidatus Palauibacter rhopaloidicola]
MTTLVPNVDLRPDHWAIVCNALRRHVPDREVLAFGSRATWTAKDYSDLDLAVMGEEPLSLRTASALDEALGDSDLPFKVDVVDWARTDEGFRRIIRLHGIVVQGVGGSAKATVSVREPSPKSKSRDSAATRDRKSVAGAIPLEGLAYVIMGQSPAGSTVGRSNGMPLINGPTEFGPHHPKPVQYTSDPRKLAQPGDLLFCVRGATAGRMNWADQQYAIGRGIAAIRHRRDHSLQPFLRAAISSELPLLLAATTGSVFRNVSASQLKDLRIPDLRTSQQRDIAHVLGTLDDKIELNRRMNETLEAMARALFKSWF